eukprot:2854588-Pyramimonas_sp.AAC.1
MVRALIPSPARNWACGAHAAAFVTSAGRALAGAAATAPARACSRAQLPARLARPTRPRWR